MRSEKKSVSVKSTDSEDDADDEKEERKGQVRQENKRKRERNPPLQNSQQQVETGKEGRESNMRRRGKDRKKCDHMCACM